MRRHSSFSLFATMPPNAFAKRRRILLRRWTGIWSVATQRIRTRTHGCASCRFRRLAIPMPIWIFAGSRSTYLKPARYRSMILHGAFSQVCWVDEDGAVTSELQQVEEDG